MYIHTLIWLCDSPSPNLTRNRPRGPYGTCAESKHTDKVAASGWSLKATKAPSECAPSLSAVASGAPGPRLTSADTSGDTPLRTLRQLCFDESGEENHHRGVYTNAHIHRRIYTGAYTQAHIHTRIYKRANRQKCGMQGRTRWGVRVGG